MRELKDARRSAGQLEAGEKIALIVLVGHAPSPPRFDAISTPLSVMTTPRRSNAARSADRSTGLISLPLSKRVMVARLTSDAFDASVIDRPSPARAILDCAAVSVSFCVFSTLVSIFAAFASRKLI
jgi:hypothetical protein